MQLSEFIRSETGTILLDWDDFAETFVSAPGMSKTELRDHAQEMLLAIADDIDTAQSAPEQDAKSKGQEAEEIEEDSWAKVHGRARHASGFDVNETVSEFRALRASVLLHWSKATTEIVAQDLEDLTRFNEAIDQAVAESLNQYSAEKEMQTRLFAAVLVASPDPIGVLDLEGKYIYANQAMADMFAKPPSEIIGKRSAELGLPFSEFQQPLQQVGVQQSGQRGETAHRCSTGEVRRYEHELAPVMDEQGRCEAIVCISRDVTERAGAEEQSRHHAHHDPLTGLPNRRLFLDRLDQEFKHAKRRNLPLALLFIDLDGFKEINDGMGHEAGDRLLVGVAERLADCIREDDTIARLGGDEFTVILSGAMLHRDVELVAQLIITKLEVPFHIAGKPVSISASIGAALTPEHASSPDALLRAADEAMYQAKTSAGSRFCFYGAPGREAKTIN